MKVTLRFPDGPKEFEIRELYTKEAAELSSYIKEFNIIDGESFEDNVVKNLPVVSKILAKVIGEEPDRIENLYLADMMELCGAFVEVNSGILKNWLRTLNLIITAKNINAIREKVQEKSSEKKA